MRGTRIIFAGDIHGSKPHLAWVMREAADRGADYVFSVGDFGYWPHYPDGQNFLEHAHALASEYELPILWIPGNHENWDAIDKLVKKHGHQHPIPTPPKSKRYASQAGTVQLVPRGCVLEMDGTTILGMGGAWSIDWNRRIPGNSWWPQEVLTPEHLDLVSDVAADILVTHDAPLGGAISYPDEHPTGMAQRRLVSEIATRVSPSLIVCGHHHVRATWRDQQTGAEVQVLNRDCENFDDQGQPTDRAWAEESILLADTVRWKRQRAKDAALPLPA